MKDAIHAHLIRHFGIYMILSNILIAVGLAGLAFMGVLVDSLTVGTLFGAGGALGITYAIGKFFNEELEDLPKVLNVEAMLCSTKCK